MNAVSKPTSPLPIAEIRAGEGVIGLTVQPGKTEGGAGPARDLKADLEAVAGWRPASVVSLVELPEFGLLGVSNFPDEVARLSADWHHLPVVDMQVPDAQFERDWIYHGHVLRQRLQRGGRVLLHCRGGLGRSGMIAARLLVEMGADPEAAIARVRSAQPDAIETAAQEAHVRACRPATGGAHADRVLGCLLGGAIGDAFGYPVEFISLSRIRRTYGAEGIAGPELNDKDLWEVSDDTQMTLFTVEGLVDGLVQGGDPVASVRAAYRSWFATQTDRFDHRNAADRLASFRELWARRAPGNTCLSALSGGGQGTLERALNNSKGCGGVMRTAPIGLLRSLSTEQCLELGARAAAITHGHPSGYWSAGAIAAIVRLACDGVPTADAVQQTIGMLGGRTGSGETVTALRKALDPGIKTIGKLGEGWVGEEALAMGVHAVLRGRNLKEVLMIAVNHDGDSDSTGSIAGQIWGASQGVDGMPVGWVSALDVRAPLYHAAGRLLAVA
jgi:ADP-ribosylglycohydrolase/protein-tyrosine phosphatase